MHTLKLARSFIAASMATLITAIAAAPASSVAGEDVSGSLLTRLLSEGVTFPSERVVPLSGPWRNVLDGEALGPATRSRIAGSTEWSSFARDSVVAPTSIDLDYVRADNGQRIGHRIHFAFVVHQDFATLRDPETLRELLPDAAGNADSEKEFESGPVSPETLAARQIDNVEEGTTFHEVAAQLLDRVTLSGVVRCERVAGDDFIAIAWLFDPRFTDAVSEPAGVRNVWVPLLRDDLGRRQTGSPRSYRGAGGYLIVSELSEIKGATLVEAEAVLHEPADWFSGSNLLRSKLPQIIQASVRRFRRGVTATQ